MHLVVYLVDHRSTALLILATGVAIGAALGMTLAFLVAFRLSFPAVFRLRRRAERWRTLYLLVGFAAAFAFGVGIRPEWVYAHIALTLSTGLLLGYELLFGTEAPPSRRWFLLAAIAALGITALRVYALAAYPTHIVVDEPWDLGWAVSYVQRGYLFDPILYYGGFDVQRFMLPVAWWISAFGVGFWQVRLFFFLLILPLIGITALVARNWSLSGTITAFILFASVVVMSAARIRHDIGLAIALAASLWAVSAAEKRGKTSLHLLGGLCIGLGWFAHYHATGFGVALAISLYAPEIFSRWRQRRWLPPAGFWAFVAGGILGALLVVLLQILPDWQGFLNVRLAQPRTPASLEGLLRTFFAHWNTLVGYSQLEFILILVALAAALWRRTRTDVRLVLLVVTLHVALALMASEPYVYYVVPLTPVYALLIAGLFTRGWLKRAAPLAVGWVWAAFFILPVLGITLQTPLQQLRARAPLQLPTPPAAAWMLENVDPSTSILAEHWYYLFLSDYPFISSLSVNYAPLSERLASSEAMWDEIAPDVIILDRNLSTCCMPPILTTDYLASRGYTVVAEFPGERYPVFIYEKGANE